MRYLTVNPILGRAFCSSSSRSLMASKTTLNWVNKNRGESGERNQNIFEVSKEKRLKHFRLKEIKKIVKLGGMGFKKPGWNYRGESE